MKYCVSLFLITLIFGNSAAQTGDREWRPVGFLIGDKNSSFKVKLLSYENPSFCISKNGESQYSWSVRGTFYGTPFYLNWKIYYKDCEGKTICKINSTYISKLINDEYNQSNLTWKFRGDSLTYPYYEILEKSTLQMKEEEIEVKEENLIAPTRIIAKNLAAPGEKITLQVEGGSLTSDADWFWYVNNCDENLVGQGEKISVKVVDSRTFFVRAESKKNKTDCISKSIQVRDLSIAPEKIVGDSVICDLGKKNKLIVLGGRLEKGADWFWYKDNLGKNYAGKGPFIYITDPTVSEYFVRAEGKNNVTGFVSIKVSILTKSQDPVFIKVSGNTRMCEGNELILTVYGGKIGDDGASWNWYEKNPVKIKYLGSGKSFKCQLNSSTFYMVKAEGLCGSTAEREIEIQVLPRSKTPYRIVANGLGVTGSYQKNRPIVLSQVGGELREGSKWTWYTSENQDRPTKVGSGDQIEIKPKRSFDIILKAEGNVCDENLPETRQHISVEDNIISSARNNIRFFNIGLTSSWPFTNEYAKPLYQNYNIAVLYGILSRIKKAGWYISGKYCINSFSSAYNINSFGQLELPANQNVKIAYNGQGVEKRYGATCGLLTGNGKINFKMGAGWGRRFLYWGTTEKYINEQGNIIEAKNWANHKRYYYNNLEMEIGLLIKLKRLNIQIGGSNIFVSKDNLSFKHFDFNAGIGFCF